MLKFFYETNTNLRAFRTFQTSLLPISLLGRTILTDLVLTGRCKGEGMIEREGKEKFNCPTISVCLS
jgi:hypothetical protein